MLAGALSLGGCAILFPPEKPFVVSDSQLNWLNISYRPANLKRPPCRIAIMGAGYVRYISGESPLVADDFATDTADASWGDVAEEKLGITPAEARALMQGFADAGLMSEPAVPRGRGKPLADAPGVALFNASLNGEKKRCVTANPDLVALVELLAEQLGTRRR
jgi:hypothetical protein